MSCLFCKIVAKKIPADLLFESDTILAFKDIHPQAPFHALFIPKKHIEHALSFELMDATLYSDIFFAIRETVKKNNLPSSGYRILSNLGASAGQSVFHVHFHVLGGRPLSWPPG